MLKACKIRITFIILPVGKRYKVLFDTFLWGWKDEGSNLPTVNLSRQGDHCPYRLNELHKHRSCSLYFDTYSDVQTYINRVAQDIRKALK